MSELPIDWKAIKPLSGSRAKGFEELCSQLARSESPVGSTFKRKGTPDAGVECYTILPDGSEWGWQAKYFDELGDPQWSQIDDSVKKALEKHPKLLKYFVCIPVDRPDARVEGRKSAMDRWIDHAKTWVGWASEQKISIDFVYWGSSELLERLIRSENVGRVRFWFDVRLFETEWFKTRLDESVKTAGPRYTPEINVDLPIAGELETFGRTEQFFAKTKSLALNIRKRLRDLENHKPQSNEQKLNQQVSELSSDLRSILCSLSDLSAQPIGVIPLREIVAEINKTEAAANDLENLLSHLEREYDKNPPVHQDSSAPPTQLRNPYGEYRTIILRLLSVLQDTEEIITHDDRVANCSLMLLSGNAGTGKTHLLCDVTRKRIETGKPTILLMGQRFVSLEEPWTQILRQLDLRTLSAEEFIGGLEAAAQVADCRALFIIDAINEGSGTRIWPDNLAAFITQLERSPWISVLFSFRPPYEEMLIPKETRDRAINVTHHGFTEHEYDASRTFFTHYNIDLPSTPLLSPEFRNPLFLKTLCSSLQSNGDRTLPRGFQGFTFVFNHFIASINKRLASTLDFNPKHTLVRDAIERIAEAVVVDENRSLTLRKAEEIVNALLPGREFAQSLYHGLITEGILVEEAIPQKNGDPQVIVILAYERLSDHLIAKILLDKYLNLDNPALAFELGAPLAFIWDKSRYISPGLLEAMWIQISERTKKELGIIAPNILKHWGIGNAFRQSLIWREITAFSKETLHVLNILIQNKADSDDTLDVLLTVAMLEEHPYNANFLDKRLNKDSMPERDAWWSIYLHQAWGTHGSVDRLVTWASSITPDKTISDGVVDLCSIVLAWMLTTSNRFLRDNTTQALVNLLTGRQNAVKRLVQNFQHVNDLYVKERIFAVAYGVAMRSHRPDEVDTLAQCVYDLVFAHEPPPHILLRDYARGIVERAIYLQAKIEIVETRIRPPYASQWPVVPDEEEIKPFLPNWSRGSHESRDIEWARNRIGSSVMDDDFSTYVISTKWSSLKLDEPKWQTIEARLTALANNFGEEEKTSWERFKVADEAVNELSMKRFMVIVRSTPREGAQSDEKEDQKVETDIPNQELDQAILKRDLLSKELESKLTKPHFEELEMLLSEQQNPDSRRPPRFDIRLIQRYIIKRVFDLGWTTERFGEFDRFSIGYHGRDAHKAERIGKKYQWIAYHEIMALIADHFQFIGDSYEDSDKPTYEGPWQDHFRDLDPSCTMGCSRQNSPWDAHSRAWWCPVHYDNWSSDDAIKWLTQLDDIPNVPDFLFIQKPTDNSTWLNVQSFFLWKQPAPPDQDRYDVEQRELWFIVTGYLIQTQDKEAFKNWAEQVDFYGRWMPDPPEWYRMFLGEYGWSPAFRYFQRQYFHDSGENGWTQPDHDCPTKVLPVAFEYLREASGFDCSVDENYTFHLPVKTVIDGLRLRWSGNGADFVDATGRIITFDPTAHDNGPHSLLFREDRFKEFLKQEKLSFCWIVIGEKQAVGPDHGTVTGRIRISGAYILEDEGPVGSIKMNVFQM